MHCGGSHSTRRDLGQHGLSHKGFQLEGGAVQTLLQPACAKGNTSVRLINLIGPCHPVKKERRRAFPDKNQRWLTVLLGCAALETFSSWEGNGMEEI